MYTNTVTKLCSTACSKSHFQVLYVVQTHNFHQFGVSKKPNISTPLLHDPRNLFSSRYFKLYFQRFPLISDNLLLQTATATRMKAVPNGLEGE